jgi:hypothetical protein
MKPIAIDLDPFLSFGSPRKRPVSYDRGIAMTRRFIYHGLVVSALAVGSLGCDTTRSFLRPKDHDDEVAKKQDSDDASKPKAVESDTSKILSVDSDKDNQKPFFQNNRKSGGWSSEAREIERDLGAY